MYGPRIILSALASAKPGPSSLPIDPWLPINTPGYVVRGNQNYANKIFTGASGHELQTVGRMSTNLLSRYLLISKREIDNWAMWFSIVFISIQD